MNNKVVYTCLTGNYDIVRQPLAVAEGWDYICFCDGPVPCEDGGHTAPGERCGVWQMCEIPFTGDSKTLSRYPKIMPHKVLGEYDWSLYIDANLQIREKTLYEIADQHISEDHIICQVPHPERDCMYDEIVECYKLRHIKYLSARHLRNSLIKKGFPRHFGLWENNIILRSHNEPRIIALDESWWNDWENGPKRDQLSLAYRYWTFNLRPYLLLGEGVNARNTPLLKYYAHAVTPARMSWFRRKTESIRIKWMCFIAEKL